MAEIVAIWEARREESRKHSVSRVLQLYLDKRYYEAIESTGHTGKVQDFVKEAILNETQRRFNQEVIESDNRSESDKERADRLQNEVIAIEAKLNDLLQAMQKVCSSISI